MIIIQPSASRTTNLRAHTPSSKLLGYYHSSALRTDNSTFWAKPRERVSEFDLNDSNFQTLTELIETYLAGHRGQSL
jgi:hypothetical protein